MTIQDWGAIGEVVGAVAVVITLAYLATQIRYARLAASDASRQSRAHGVREILLTVINNREFREAWARSDPETDALMATIRDSLGVSADDASVVWYGCCAWAYVHWAQYRSMKSPEDERELENLVSAFYARPPMAPVWKHSELLRAMLDPEFVAWVDRILARTPAPGDPHRPVPHAPATGTAAKGSAPDSPA